MDFKSIKMSGLKHEDLLAIDKEVNDFLKYLESEKGTTKKMEEKNL